MGHRREWRSAPAGGGGEEEVRACSVDGASQAVVRRVEEAIKSGVPGARCCHLKRGPNDCTDVYACRGGGGEQHIVKAGWGALGRKEVEHEADMLRLVPPAHPCRSLMPELLTWGAMAGWPPGYYFVERRLPPRFVPATEARSGADARVLCNRVVSGLRALHSAGLTHGDPHAGNVFVDPDTLDVVFIDFGYAVRCHREMPPPPPPSPPQEEEEEETDPAMLRSPFLAMASAHYGIGMRDFRLADASRLLREADLLHALTCLLGRRGGAEAYARMHGMPVGEAKRVRLPYLPCRQYFDLIDLCTRYD